MKERPIIFSAPMVRAILDGRKTQTRRVVKCKKRGKHDPHNIPCPYGQPGDRLWVRETWRISKGYDNCKPRKKTGSIVHYEADGNPIPQAYGFRWGKRRPSIFMPRHASRITLEVVSVRVERLRDINHEDIEREGIPDVKPPCEPYNQKLWDRLYRRSAKMWFIKLWDTIAKPDAKWDDNPWVWVVEFRKVTP